MRPLRLQVKGFTAFRDEQELDFADLDVFAIAGPTGSGKSSLLDAMTYALFGCVERVGRQVGQLISQGQPSMSVSLEFEVDGSRYRVGRRTPVKGATKVLLERLEDGEWRQAGEGADRVREVDARIERLIGLDYRAFTRSVLLPQGKFAEFLTGEARERREILTELLGLSLFERMAKAAGNWSKEAGTEAAARRALLDRDYADATPEALTEARRAAELARGREAALADGERVVTEALRAVEGAVRTAEERRGAAADARRAAAEARAVGDEAAAAADRQAGARRAVEERREEAAAAAAAVEAARADLAEQETASGSEVELVAARTQAEAALALAARAGEAAERADVAAAEVPAREETAAAADRGRDEADRDAVERAAALERARSEERAAARAHAAEDLREGLSPGDPCPVCGRPLEGPVAEEPAPDLERARAVVAGAEAAAAAADRAARDAAAVAQAAGYELQRSTEERDRLREEAASAQADAEAAQTALAGLFEGAAVPEDAVAAIDSRLERLRLLAGAVAGAEAALADREAEVGRAERDLGALADEASTVSARILSLPLASIRERAGRAGVDLEELSPGLSASGRERAASLVEAAAAAAGWLEVATGALDRAADELAGAEAEHLARARDALGDLVSPAGSLRELAEAAAKAARRASADAAVAARAAEDLSRRLEGRAALNEEIGAFDRRRRVFHELALELRSDRLIAYLQAEALQVLSAAGSERLARLSDGRFRLRFEDDEFWVVDTWNGDERRHVRTLSGGETFLASLSLALALSEQVRSLSVADRSRVDSLFLDEGFGSLDPESLRVVVEAIEQLGGDGRLVGVITHVRDLAEQFPRVEVEKSPRGSRLLRSVEG